MSYIPTKNDLDISWIEEMERIESLDKNCLREKMDSINVYYIYINRNEVCDSVLREKIDLESTESDYSTITKEKLIYYIQNKKRKTADSKYVLKDTLLFHVDLEPEQILSFSQSESFLDISKKFLHVYPILEDIQISPSIFIFHPLNALYFIYHEVGLNKINLKSILRDETKKEFGKSTKRVRIQLPNSCSNTRKKLG
jgi:hypothetical protein